MTDVDLYAGAGGWDIAARQLGLDPIGFEFDPMACATRAAAGLRTIRADLAHYAAPAGLTITGLIGSPPCPAFSAAGNGSGRLELPDLIAATDRDQPCPDHLSIDAHLLAVPLEWVDRHRPRWVALEQVPPVLPYWQAAARWLQRRGYRTWCGILCAADYGVPQTRRRAILIAHADRPVAAPAPTHAENPTPTLFGDDLAPWVSMADALDLPDGLVVDLNQNTEMGGGRLERYTRSADRPSAVVTGRSARGGGGWTLNTRCGWGDNPVTRDSTEPAPTVTSRAAFGQWVLDNGGHGRTNDRTIPRRLDQPAPTVAAGSTARYPWMFRRPATTVACDSRVWPPGHKINQGDIDRLGEAEARERYGDRAGTEAVRVTVEQAARLQDFPDGFPFQGTQEQRARQVGNAVPVGLARAVLAEVAL